jgi:hypothetical protein
MSDKFPDADVTITLKGREWAAILGRIDRPAQLSAFGRRTYSEAAGKLGTQLLDAQARIQGRVPEKA